MASKSSIFGRGFRDSGVEWLGEIPAQWNLMPLFAVACERDEGNTSGEVTNVLSLSYGNIILRDVERNFGLLPKSFNTYQVVRPGNIVMRLTDLQNDKRSLRTGLVREKGIITSAYLVLHPKESLSSEYLHYLLHAYDITKVFYAMGAGVRQTMKFADIKHMPVTIPPLSEQRAIANFLDHQTARIDSLIIKKQRLIELLEEKRNALITQAVTRGLDPDVPMKDSGMGWLGDIPEHWEISRLKYVAKIIMGQSPDSSSYNREASGLPFLQGNADFSRVFPRPRIYCENPRKKAKKDDLLFSVRAPVGAQNIADQTYGIGRGLCAIRVGGNIALYFLWFNIRACKIKLDWEATGSTYDAVDVTQIGNLEIPMPPLSEQKEITAYLKKQSSKIDELIKITSQVIEKLQEYRSSLISAVVTGKLDVRDCQPEEL